MNWSAGFTARNPCERLSLASLTTFRIGGPAEVVTLNEVGDLDEALSRPHHILGRGANLLVSDAGLPVPVLRLGEPFAQITALSIGSDTVEIEVGAGLDLARLISHAAAQGWAGLEVLAGVPATVGGATRMNAGTRHGWLSDSLHAVLVARPGRRPEWIEAATLQPTYRDGGLPADALALAVRLRLRRDDPAAIRARGAQLKRAKAATQPLALPSAGCMFTNPAPDLPAGRLIDDLGLKGMRVGGVAVSDVHANFVVNDQGGSAADVLELVRRIQARARSERGVDLVMEVRCWGLDDAEEHT